MVLHQRTELYDLFFCEECDTLTAQTVRGNVNPQYKNIANDFCPGCNTFQNFNDFIDIDESYFSLRQDTKVVK